MRSIRFAAAVAVGWTAAHAVGFVLAFVLCQASAAATGLGDGSLATIFPVVGLLIGAIQWIFLRCTLVSARWWIVGSMAGFAVGIVVLALVFGASVGLLGGETTIGLSLASLAGGAVMGTAQWATVRRSIRCAGWWIPATAVGFAAALLLFLSLTRGGGAALLIQAKAAGAAGAVYGLITGATLAWLLARGERSEQTSRLNPSYGNRK